MGISGPWRFEAHRFGASAPSQPHLSQGSEPSPAAGLGLIFPISGKVFGASLPEDQLSFYHPCPPHSKPCPSPLSSSLLFSWWLCQPLELCAHVCARPWVMPGCGGDFDSGRGSGYNSQARNNKSLSTQSQLGSRAGRAWLSSFPGMGLPQLLTVMGIFRAGSLG